jgi:hypothetical protein
MTYIPQRKIQKLSQALTLNSPMQHTSYLSCFYLPSMLPYMKQFKITETFIYACKDVGLEVNAEKTEYVGLLVSLWLLDFRIFY